MIDTTEAAERVRSLVDPERAKAKAKEKLPGPLRRAVEWLGRLWGEIRDDRVTDLAAEVAFFAVLSLFPAFIAFAAVLGVLDGIVGADFAVRVEDAVIEYLESVLTSEAEGTLDAVRDLFASSSPQLLTFSLLAAFFSLSRGFAGLIRALDVVYDLDEHRGWFSIRFTAILLAIGSILSAAIILALVVVGPLFGSGQDIADEIGLGSAFVTLWDWIRFPFAFLALVGYSATIFHLAPDHRTPWRSDLPGAVVASVLWLLGSIGFRSYLGFATGGNQVFGVLGGALIVLLWFYVLSLAVLVGGEINEMLWRSRKAPGTEEAST